MSSYILTIKKDHVTEHWRLAVQHGLWDLRTGPNIEEGDEVYFWGARVGLLGRVRVIESARPISALETKPWRDAVDGQYLKRFRFELVSDRPRRQPGWTAIKEKAGITQPLPHKPRVLNPAGEEWLAGLFA